MANPMHVQLVLDGATTEDRWWWRRLARQRLDLREAELGGAELFRAYLRGADLSSANLRGADLREADLSRALLAGADLRGANLRGVSLIAADLTGADLRAVDMRKSHLGKACLRDAKLVDADLSGADLNGADLAGADLSNSHFVRANLSACRLAGANLAAAIFVAADVTGADFTAATCQATVFVNCNLHWARGLESVSHLRPSSVDIGSLIRTWGRVPTSFLLGAGVPGEVLAALPRIIGEVRYLDCFICYGEPNRAFAERLVNDLRAKGVSCWIYAMDATPGERTWYEIGQERREADKMVVLCSAPALLRDGVLKEIEEQIDEEPDKMVPVSLDNLWKVNRFPVVRGDRDLKPFLLERNYADFANLSYEKALERLLKALERKQEASA